MRAKKSTRQNPVSGRGVCLAFLLFIFAVNSMLCAKALGMRSHTLFNRHYGAVPDAIATPTMAPHGARLLFSRRLLARNRLWLSRPRRSSFITIALPENGTAETLEFDFHLAMPANTLYAELLEENGDSRGIALSRKNLFWFRKNGATEIFTQKNKARKLETETDTWQRIRITAAQDGTRISLNGRREDFSGRNARISALRFSCDGTPEVRLDNIKISDRLGREIFSEDFSPAPLWRNTGAAMLFNAIVLAVFWLLSGAAANAGICRRLFTVMAAGITACALTLCFIFYLALDIEPSLHARVNLMPLYSGILRYSGHPAAKPYFDSQHRKPVGNRHTLDEDSWLRDMPENPLIIAFLGSSQTFEDGILFLEDSFCCLCMQSLQRAFPDRNVRCVNFAVSGASSEAMLKRFNEIKHMRGLKIAVLNMGINDRFMKTQDYGRNLTAFIDSARRAGIVPVLSLEADRDDYYSFDEFKRVMPDIARQSGAAFLDFNAYMQEHAHDGLLWWDIAHFTKGGHCVASGFFAPELKRIIARLPR